MIATVGTVSAPLVTGPGVSTFQQDALRSQTFLLKNLTQTGTVFLEHSAVGAASVGSGYPWAIGEAPLVIDLEPGQSLNAVASVAQGIRILPTGG